MPPTHTDEGLIAAQEIRDSHPEVGVLHKALRGQDAVISTLGSANTKDKLIESSTKALLEDYISEMGNRRLWNQNTGGRYTDTSQ